jgi:hypothetical protein
MVYGFLKEDQMQTARLFSEEGGMNVRWSGAGKNTLGAETNQSKTLFLLLA